MPSPGGCPGRHSVGSVEIKRSALPFVRGVHGRARLCRIPNCAQVTPPKRMCVIRSPLPLSQDALGGDAAGRTRRHGTGEKGRTRQPILVGEDFDEGDAAVVIDGDVHLLPSDAPRARRADSKRDGGDASAVGDRRGAFHRCWPHVEQSRSHAAGGGAPCRAESG